MEQLIRRLTKIRNTTDNIGWGAYDYKPFMKTDREDTVAQAVLVVGHNVYRKTYTLFLEKFSDGSYRVSLMNDCKPDEVIVSSSDTDYILARVIKYLKIWFPEIRRIVHENTTKRRT